MTPAQPLIPFYTQRPTDAGAAAASPAQKARESDELVTAIWPASGPMAPPKRSARGSSPDLRKR